MRAIKYWLLKKLLWWYVEQELDQWDIWEFATRHGKVWVLITRREEAGFASSSDKIER